MSNFYFCFCFSAQKIARLRNLQCYARAAVVATKPSFYPYFVSLHRCNGSNGTLPPHQFRCVPKKTKNVQIMIHNKEVVQFITLKNHTECEPECTIKKEDCKYPNVYDPIRCTCECHHASPPREFGSCTLDKS